MIVLWFGIFALVYMLVALLYNKLICDWLILWAHVSHKIVLYFLHTYSYDSPRYDLVDRIQDEMDECLPDQMEAVFTLGYFFKYHNAKSMFTPNPKFAWTEDKEVMEMVWHFFNEIKKEGVK